MTKFLLIPPNLRELQRPWFPKDAYPKVERIIRFGGRVWDMGNGQAQVMEWMSGGAGTVMGSLAGGQTLVSFKELSKDEYHQVTDKEKSKQVLTILYQFLAERGVRLKGGGWESERPKLMNHEILFQMFNTLELLPKSHFGHRHFKELQLGGWGGGAAKCSAYEDPEVMVFDFATTGPARNLYALLLHEIGHSFAANLPKKYVEAIDNARKKLIELDAAYGVDYLYGEDSRKNYYLFSTDEFIAETYMMYITQGAFTQDGREYLADIWSEASPDMLSRHHNFLGSIDPQARRIWNAVWSLYRKCFEGTEYV